MKFFNLAGGSRPTTGGAERLLSIALLTICLSACASLRVGSDFERSAIFSGYHAFSFLPQERHGSRNPLVVQRARDAIQGTLTNRGLVFVADSATADFVVDFTIGSAERTDINSYPAPYIGWYDGYTGWWGYPYWGMGLDVPEIPRRYPGNRRI